jgi:hypothetical protein
MNIFFCLLVDNILAHEGFLFPVTIVDICALSYFRKTINLCDAFVTVPVIFRVALYFLLLYTGLYCTNNVHAAGG